MAGRGLAFADAEILRLAKEEFVPVAGDDWYQRRREDVEGEFFRRVADQGPRKGKGGLTRQGVYVLTASGKLLAYRPGDVKPALMQETLRRGLAEWKKLPEAERQPGAVEVKEPANVDARYRRQPPAGGLVVNVSARILDHDARGQWRRGTCGFVGGDQAARDHLWLTKEEWQSLVPAGLRKGEQFPVPAGIATRLLRFHLLDNTRGEPTAWRAEDVRSSSMRLTVEEASADRIGLRLEGEALLATNADPAEAERGYEARLLGYLGYDHRKRAFERFDIVAVGDHWGEGKYTAGARPGRKPLGIAFELASGDAVGNQVPPQSARDLDSYFGRAH